MSEYIDTTPISLAQARKQGLPGHCPYIVGAKEYFNTDQFPLAEQITLVPPEASVYINDVEVPFTARQLRWLGGFACNIDTYLSNKYLASIVYGITSKRGDHDVAVIASDVRSILDDHLTGISATDSIRTWRDGYYAVSDPRTDSPPKPRTGEMEPYMLLSGGLQLDPETLCVTTNEGKWLKEITKAEFWLLAEFASESPGRVISTDRLMRAAKLSSKRTTQVHLSSLRKKLGADFGDIIETRIGIGYCIRKIQDK
jgi:DNA-binding response OmpR family regulator